MADVIDVEDILNLFREALPGSEPSPEANFFSLGGHSMMALEIASRLGERWRIDIDAVDVITAENLRALHQMCLNAHAVADAASSRGAGEHVE